MTDDKTPIGPGRDTRYASRSISVVEGIGPVHAAKLARVGIVTTDALLVRGAKPSGRRDLEAATGISSRDILEWVGHLDLRRLKGVGSKYSDLLEAAGVDSPAELARRNPSKLAVNLAEVVAARPGIVRQVPGKSELAGWIAQAKKLPNVVER